MEKKMPPTIQVVYHLLSVRPSRFLSLFCSKMPQTEIGRFGHIYRSIRHSRKHRHERKYVKKKYKTDLTNLRVHAHSSGLVFSNCRSNDAKL